MQMNRRFFLHKGALAVAGTTALPGFLVRSVLAEVAGAPNRRLVVIFQRGAADGLNVVVPYREKNYYAMRPSIAIPQNQVIDLDGFFGLHPSLTSFKPLYDAGTSGDCARGRIAGYVALALRRAGLHGVRHAGNQEHRRRLAESRTAG